MVDINTPRKLDFNNPEMVPFLDTDDLSIDEFFKKRNHLRKSKFLTKLISGKLKFNIHINIFRI